MTHSITLQRSAAGHVVNNDILGHICFAAPNEPDGTDSILIAASIFARSEGAFAADNNATELVFVTGTTESAAPGATNYDMTLSSAGTLTLVGGLVIADGGNIGSASDTNAIAIASDGVVTMDQIPVFSAGINVSGGTIAGTLADGVVATTQSSSDNSTKVATTAYADAASSGGGRSVTGTTDNGIITWVNSGSTFVSEANLTYDDTNGLKVTSATSALPILTIENTNDNAIGATLKFNKNGTAPVDGDVVGNIDFISEDSNSNPTTYARIQSVATDVTAASEQGQIDFYVAEANGTLTKGMALTGSTTTGEIDVTIGAGGASVVTMPGGLVCNRLTMGSAVITEEELGILDGAGLTTTELNILKGSNSRDAVTIVDADGVLVNDDGTMKMVLMSSLKTYAGGGGEANESSFKTISVSGQDNVVADADDDTLTLVGGSNVTITTTAGTDTISFAATDTNTTYSVTDGELSQNNFTNTDHTKLNGIETSATADQTKSDIDGLAITTVGALSSGSIATGFGAIDNGSSTITTTGLISGGSLDIDDVLINGTTIGCTDDTDLITLTNVLVTVAGEFDVGANTDGHDVKFYGNTAGTYWMWDESADGMRLNGNFVQEAVPAANSGTEIGTGVAIIDIDWSKGNYHWVKLNDTAITNIIFRNGKRGGRYILRIEQASSAQTVSWSNFDFYNVSAGAVQDATELRWVGGTAPTMSTGTSSTDVYGFLGTRSNGAGFDAFVVAQDLQDIIT